MSAIYECECDSFEMYEEQDSFEMAEAVPGPGVPSGGLTGQVLKKRSDEDFDTEWADESGGGGGTSDYTQLSNKPQINGITLAGNKSGSDLGLVNAETGKGLSTNDYTTADKNKLSGIEAQANKTVIDSTLTNAGQAADAKKTGDEISAVKNTLTQLDAEKAGEASLAYRRSGATNTGAQIEKGTFFYLDGTLKRAIATIAQNASFTAQNCETVTAGGLNELKDSIAKNDLDSYVNVIGYTDSYYTFPADGYLQLGCNSSSTVSARIYGPSSADVFINPYATNGINVVTFVRAGMRMRCTDISGSSYYARYFKFI